MPFKPFRNGDTHGTFSNIIKIVLKEINFLDNEYILKASQSELDAFYTAKVLVDPLILHPDDYYIETTEKITISCKDGYNYPSHHGEPYQVPGTRLNIAIPYGGDSSLWRVQPNPHSMSGYPDLDDRNDRIVFSVSYADNDADPKAIKTKIDRAIKDLSDAVASLQKNVELHNRTAPEAVLDALAKKRELALTSANVIQALDIPIKRRNEPLTYSLPVTRRKLPIERPRVQTESYRPEPTIPEAEYQHILSILQSMALVIERNQKSFSTLDEQAIRDHFLIQLNGHYEGSATGETFNAEGKTDILIRAGDRNVFIAECKFWKGEASFNKAIDQLLHYLTWRDAKCALLVFNKTRESVAVREKMHATMTARPEYRKTLLHEIQGDARYIFTKTDAPGCEILITTQLYEVPKKKPSNRS